MFCGECGTQNPDSNRFCKNCGRLLKTTRPAASAIFTVPVPVPAQSPAQSPAQPVSRAQPAAAGSQVYNPPAGTAPGVAGKPKRTWLGIVSLVPAFISFFTYPYILAFLAVVLGIASIWLSGKRGTRFPASAVIAIIIGLLAFLINLFWLDIFPPPQVLPPVR